ncbi:unnamed protein product [Acanthocheilonema viteae]|uniref:Uncharacterized protein n=1 Tax=Acanthocheilonema viteae TaxID=6277 RepID=A0A498SP86_ACAVI|nr:unnamed protein product [Acanthocheilonema viteae]
MGEGGYICGSGGYRRLAGYFGEGRVPVMYWYSLSRVRNLMVELSGRSTLQHSFDNSVFIIPAVIVVAIVVLALVTYKLTSSIKLKQKREEEKRRKREERSKRKS